MTSLVQEFYKNKNVFITGGTGFVGKILIEKLIRSCEVQGIYLLVREKKQIPAQKRLDKIFEHDIYEIIKWACPKFLEKIHLMEGDISKKYLGLSKTDQTVLRTKINVVFHCAASLNMEENLKNAIQTNCSGTLELINLFKNSKKLDALVSVSTAYSACLQDVIEEKFYDPPVDYKFVIKMLNELDDKIFQNITKGLLGKFPNSYVFSKIVSEAIIKENCKGRPFGIFRPTMISTTLKEPVAGFTDNIYGPLGIITATGAGILRVKYGSADVHGDLVPVDTCVNALLCSAWEINKIWKDKENDYEPMIYNYSSNKSKLRMSYREVYERFSAADESHSKCSLWVPFLMFTENRILYWILTFFLQTIFMIIIDTGIWISGRKPILYRIYEKMYKILNVLEFFSTQEWEIRNTNVMLLWQALTPEDKKIFYFDLTKLTEEDVMLYVKETCIGLKKYIIKDDVSKEGQRRNRERYEKIVILHTMLKYSSIALLVYIVHRMFVLFTNLF